MSQYDDEAISKFQCSGKILRETREAIKDFVHENTPIIDICEKAEGLIREKGGNPAFPCNVSINEVTAHYTSPPEDKTAVSEKALVKVDIGVHVDGYVTDTAVTVSLSPEYTNLVNAAKDALEKAIENIGPDISTSKLGTIIERTIKAHGLRPISNLTGHQVGRYLVHAGTSIPNVSQLFSSKIKLGSVYAIEPFVTQADAEGRVENGKQTTIYRFVKSRSLESSYAKILLKHIEEDFRTLPFAERWLIGVVPADQHKAAFKELMKSKAIAGYPVFVEASRKPVAQAEHTVLIVKEGCVVLT